MRHRTQATLIAAFWLVCVFAVHSAPLENTADGATAQFQSRYIWHRPEDWFGGFSGLEVSPDGQDFFAITDRGYIVTGQIERSNAKIEKIHVDRASPLKNDANENVTGNLTDSEGLALHPNGRLIVSFEFVQRVWIYDRPEGTAHWASYSKEWRKFPTNAGFEALAASAKGVVFAIPESGRNTTPVYRWQHGTKWQQPFSYTLNGRFRPVGADFGPDDKLYVLERALGPFGFRSRVRRFDVGESGFSNEVVLFTSLPGKHDNLEGLSVWTDQQNRTRLTMISDDNFARFQRTEVVDYVVQE